MLKKVVLALGVIAIPSIAPAQQQPQQQLCQLECRWVNREKRKDQEKLPRLEC